LFTEIWPKVQANISDPEMRIEFTAKLLELFVRQDMDPSEVEDIHPEIRAAMRQADIELSEPDRYREEK
jgi:hypothetical protein